MRMFMVVVVLVLASAWIVRSQPKSESHGGPVDVVNFDGMAISEIRCSDGVRCSSFQDSKGHAILLISSEHE